MYNMNFSAKAVVGVCATCLVLIVSSLVMSACNSRMPNQQSQTQNTGTVQNQTANTISAEDAKSAALSHAGVAVENTTRYKSELDRDDGRLVYEIEFDSGEYEFDYEIDAQTGEIVKFDKETK